MNDVVESGNEGMSLVIISKVKKFIKEKGDMNTSANFCDLISNDLSQTIELAIGHARKMNRKTVMGKDFNLYIDQPKIEEVLVVASKVKKLIKDKSGLSTSSQVMEQLTVRVQQICLAAIENAKNDKRKTVMDRDFTVPQEIKNF